MKTLSFLPPKLTACFFAFIVVLCLPGCESNPGGGQESAPPNIAVAPAATEKALASSNNAQPEPPFEQKIIRNANLRFQVSDYRQSINAIRKVLESHGAFLVSSNEMRVDNSLENNLVIRVPAKNLDALVEKLAAQSIYLDYKNITSEDVTTEFVDISARLKAKRAVEDRYLDLLKQAKNVKEIIEVETQLRQLREEIESTQARINYINRQVAYSTINLQIYESSARQSGDQNFLIRIQNALRDGWELLLSFVVGLLYIWPFLLITILVAFGLKKFLKKQPPVR